jgi:DNA-binding MarR family transcriptional regulator
VRGNRSGKSGSQDAALGARRPKTPFDQLKALLRPKRGRRSLSMTEDHIISILILRRARDEIFGSSLFAEPAWDVLLELYAAGLGGRRMSLRDIALAIKIPESTAARWVAALADHGLVSAHADPNQPIMPWLALTERGAAQMKQLADHWRSAFLSI